MRIHNEVMLLPGRMEIADGPSGLPDKPPAMVALIPGSEAGAHHDAHKHSLHEQKNRYCKSQDDKSPKNLSVQTPGWQVQGIQHGPELAGGHYRRARAQGCTTVQTARLLNRMTHNIAFHGRERPHLAASARKSRG